MDSAEQHVFDQLKANLADVTVANGFNFEPDVVLTYSETPTNIGVSKLVCVELGGSRPLPDRDQPSGKQAKRMTVAVYVRLTVYDEGATQEQGLSWALADIEKQVLTQPFLDGKSTRVIVRGSERRHTSAGNPESSGRLDLDIDYRHTQGDPYDLTT